MKETIRYTYSPGRGSRVGSVIAHAGKTPVGALSFHPPMAWVDVDEEAGTMISTSQPRIIDAAVREEWQRQGIGSEMHRIASREIGALLAHSGSRTPAGHAFAKATGGHTPNGDVPTMAPLSDRYPGHAIDMTVSDTENRGREVPGAPKMNPQPTQALSSPQWEQLQFEL